MSSQPHGPRRARPACHPLRGCPPPGGAVYQVTFFAAGGLAGRFLFWFLCFCSWRSFSISSLVLAMARVSTGAMEYSPVGFISMSSGKRRASSAGIPSASSVKARPAWKMAMAAALRTSDRRRAASVAR